MYLSLTSTDNKLSEKRRKGFLYRTVMWIRIIDPHYGRPPGFGSRMSKIVQNAPKSAENVNKIGTGSIEYHNHSYISKLSLYMTLYSSKTMIRWKFFSDVDPDPHNGRPPGSGSVRRPMRIQDPHNNQFISTSLK